MLATNNKFDLVIFCLFTLAVIFIGLPGAIYLIVKGVEGFAKYKLGKLPDNFLIASRLGDYSLEIIFYGMLIFIFSVWYLLFDKGGQLANFIVKLNSF